MDPAEVQRLMRLNRIIYPYASRQYEALGDRRMVHYTTAENAYRIVASKTMWMRNTNTMVDYSEVVFGTELLNQFFRQETQRNAFLEAMGLCYPGVGDEVLKQFDAWFPATRFATYVACISEHEDSEHAFGRLSMWRGFGQNAPARAAMVMKMPERGSAEGLSLILMPVAYFGYDQVEQQFWDMINGVRQNVEFLKTFEPERFRNILFFMLVATAVTLKHPSFKEEREWRVIYLPDANSSNLIKSSIEVVGGIPQIVYKIPLEENPAENVVGVGIPTLLERIIIGPTMYGAPIQMAFIRALSEAGVAEARSKVVVSPTPIRS